jgi:hypothetical protein
LLAPYAIIFEASINRTRLPILAVEYDPAPDTGQSLAFRAACIAAAAQRRSLRFRVDISDNVTGNPLRICTPRALRQSARVGTYQAFRLPTMIRRNVLIGNASRDVLLAFCEWNDRNGDYEQPSI